MRPWRTRAVELRLLVLAVADRCDQRCVHCQIWQGTRRRRRSRCEERLRGRGRGARARASRRRCSPAASRSCRRTCGPSRERLRAGGARLMLATNGMLLARYAREVARLVRRGLREPGRRRTRPCTTRSAACRPSRAWRRASLALRAAAPSLPGSSRAASCTRATSTRSWRRSTPRARLGCDHVSFLPLDASSDAFGARPGERVRRSCRRRRRSTASRRRSRACSGGAASTTGSSRRARRSCAARAPPARERRGGSPFERPRLRRALVVERRRGRRRRSGRASSTRRVGDVRAGLAALRAGRALSRGARHASDRPNDDLRPLRLPEAARRRSWGCSRDAAPVVLYNPRGESHILPLALVHVGSALPGQRVVIVDGRIDPDAERTRRASWRRTRCAWASRVLTGAPILDALPRQRGRARRRGPTCR